MNIEDRIREAMTAHEHEAPSVADFHAHDRDVVVALPRRHTAWLAAATAACVLAVAVVVAIVAAPGRGRQHTVASPGPVVAALSCPKSYDYTSLQPWVPAPAKGVDGSTRLAPRQTPARVLVCAFLRGTNLSGSREVRGDLAAVSTTLTWLPRNGTQSRPCTSDLQPNDGDAYLVGLTYPSGTIWVSAPGNHCSGASNGEFGTAVNLRAPVAAAYTTGRWTVGATGTPSGDHDPCHVGTAGRLGQEKIMVPRLPISATVCQLALSNQSSAVAHRVVTDLGPLTTALNSPATKPSNSSCGAASGDTHPQTVMYEVLVRYTDGPAVFVRVLPGCHPSIDNMSLQADDHGEVVSVIKALLAGH